MGGAAPGRREVGGGQEGRWAIGSASTSAVPSRISCSTTTTSRTLTVAKVPSVPADPSAGIVQGIVGGAADRRCRGRRGGVRRARHHGRDQHAPRAHRRPHGAHHHARLPRPPRDRPPEAARRSTISRRASLSRSYRRYRRWEVAERVMADGRVRIPLDTAGVERVLAQIAEPDDGESVEALAICFLYAFSAPEHERQVLERARARFPALRDRDLARGASRVPRVRAAEHHRGQRLPRSAHERATCARSASASPRSASGPCPTSTSRTAEPCRSRRPRGRPCAPRCPGPAPAWPGAAWIAAQAGFDAIATFDMGGTSTDVAFVRGGAPALAFEREIGGVTLRVPALDIHTVGRRRRLDRLARLGRRAEGGAAERGRRPRPGLLRAGRRGADRHRRQSRPRPARALGARSAARMPLDPARSSPPSPVSRGSSVCRRSRRRAGIVRVVNANMANAVRWSPSSAAWTRPR